MTVANVKLLRYVNALVDESIAKIKVLKLDMKNQRKRMQKINPKI